MLIERLVGYVVSKKIKNYLYFEPNALCNLPQRKNSQSPLMLYIHIPFCEEMCTYCSFHRVTFRENLTRAYFAALRKEILLYKEEGYNFGALYIGGGTPTVLIDELVATIELIKKCFSITEISVETNPNHLDMEKMIILKEAGVGRLSVGVQSFDDDILKATDRYHKYGSGEQIINKIKEIQGLFKTLNVDMIFNFPTQTEKMLQRDLDIILDLKVDQVTFYPLMVSTTTRKDIERKLGTIKDERGRRYYEIITTTLKSEYRASTAWCFARDEFLIDEYVVNYEEYAGIGSGAFGYLNGTVYANLFDIPEYIRQVQQGKYPITARRDCNPQSAILYDFMMQFFGLSIDLSHLWRKYGLYAMLHLSLVVLFFMLIGSIKREGRNGSFVVKNPYHGVIMMRKFFTSVNDFRDYCRSRVTQSPNTEELLEKPI
ncbi:MAG: coproporphyrinogen oxidase [Firmicutes bacterium]|nr:coproporphyrinogen oxidase [Bacillota bacterium]